MVGVVLGALVLAGVGTTLAANRGARADAAREVAQDARRVAAEAPAILASTSGTLRRRAVSLVRAATGAHFLLVAPGVPGSGPSPALGRVPTGVTIADLALRRVLGGAVVAGTAGTTVFAAVSLPEVAPSALAGRRLARDAQDTVVVVLTRHFAGAGLGGGYLVLVSGIALVVAAGLAVWLSRRLTRPLVDAVGATERVAAGDLSARLPEPRHTAELASLARSINAMAAGLARARGQEREFLLSVSHDLRTPLTSILGYAEAIAEGAVDDPAAAAGVITSEARRLGRLVQDLLDLARLDARQFSLRPVALDIVPVLRAAADGIWPLVDAAGLHLDVQLPSDALPVVADPDRAAQVVGNLLENAYKFATTTVSVRALASDGWVEVAVADDGPGVAADEAPHVFERLYQSGRAQARQGGTGLGLAIVAELMAAMGGTVRVVSPAGPATPTAGASPSTPTAPAGPGSRFEVRFPAATR